MYKLAASLSRNSFITGSNIKHAGNPNDYYLIILLMKRIKTFALLFPFVIISCSRGGGDNPPPPPPAEENLVIGIDPDPGAVGAKALGATYDFKLLITSKMPEKGVEGTVVFRKESDNSLLSSQNIQTSATPLNIAVSNIAINEVGIVTIDVKSKSKPSNTATKTFKLSRK